MIDFEYASANVPALEFANHFVRSFFLFPIEFVEVWADITQTEWCYNYHDPSKPYALNERLYPNLEEQHRFLKAYIQHRSPTSQAQNPAENPASSSSSFILDNRAPSAEIVEEERARERSMEAEIQQLMQEIRLWRIANSAQWVAWGIVQAKVEMDGLLECPESKNVGISDITTGKQSSAALESDPPNAQDEKVAKNAHDQRPDGDNISTEAKRGNDGEVGEEGEEGEEEEEEEEFDYLAYAQERALFFWGDVLQMGLVKKEDLPAELLQKLKIVRY